MTRIELLGVAPGDLPLSCHTHVQPRWLPGLFVAAVGAAALLAANALFGPTAVRAQSVLVRVQESETAQPIPGAVITLERADGQVVRSALSDDHGRYLFSAFGPGSFVVRAEAVGRATASTAGLEVTGDELIQPLLTLPPRGDAANAASGGETLLCRDAQASGSAVAGLLDEVHKALRAVVLSGDQKLYAYRLRGYERDMDAASGTVVRDGSRTDGLATRNPVRTPSRDEAGGGAYVRRLESGEYDYFAPDASAFLSSTFRDTHCYRRDDSRSAAGVVGIGFASLRKDGESDVEGTYWLDNASMRLRSVEFRYTALPWGLRDPRLGGTLRFETLPGGTWLLRRWAIRMPLVQGDSASEPGSAESPARRLAGLREVGQEITSVERADGTPLLAAAGGGVAGRVYDSTLVRPLVGARVALAGTEYTAVTDSAGAFRISGVREGRYRLGFAHPRLDTLGIDVAPEAVAVPEHGIVRTDLAVPSSATLRADLCDGSADGGGVILGTVRDEKSGVELANVRVQIGAKGMAPIRATTDARGRYLACAVPADVPLRVSASVSELSSGVAETRVGPGAWVAVPLLVPVSDLAPPPASAPAAGVEGALIRGRVREAETGRVIAMADVAVLNIKGDTVARVFSGQDGMFRVSVPDGSRYQVAASALGYAEVPPGMVDVDRGQAVDIDVRLSARAFALEELVVTVERRSLALERTGFYERKIANVGTFVTPEQIKARDPRQVSDMFMTIPSAVLVEDGLGHRDVLFRGNGGGCWPRVIVDGMPVALGGSEKPGLDYLLSGRDLEAIEVYKRPAQVPAQYGGAGSGCGVVIIWTKH